MNDNAEQIKFIRYCNKFCNEWKNNFEWDLWIHRSGNVEDPNQWVGSYIVTKEEKALVGRGNGMNQVIAVKG